jgi:4-hydroxybutyrate CoA-transferase
VRDSVCEETHAARDACQPPSGGPGPSLAFDGPFPREAGFRANPTRWAESYRRRVTTADEAVKVIRSGDRVWVHPGCSNPEELVRAMVARARQLQGVEVTHLMTFGCADYVDPCQARSFRHRALFVGANVRRSLAEGRADFIPVHLSEIPRLLESGAMKVDVALVHVSPPDEHGYCSFGVGVESTKAAVEKARTVIALVNRRMPRSLGDSFIHASRLTHVIEADRPVLELPAEGRVGEAARAIGEHVSELVEDGATLQIGIGEIPDAVLLSLDRKRDLGVHTEMFSDGVVALFEKGVITNAAKTIHRGKIVASFVLGSRKAFDFLDNNPFVELHPSDYVNDPFVIARNDKMVAINSALSVDLTGQVCADSLGPDIYSGVGGQLDFIRGASRSKGGKPIIALPATAKGGTVSRIVDTLAEGSGVVTTRADVHYVVTEHGVAFLFGKTLRERARALIAIADPLFRDELEAAARRRKLI